jgi:foldase protein PrsA
MSYAKRVILACAAAGFGLAPAACSSAAAGGGDVASVNGAAISRADYDARLESGPQGKAVLNQMIQGLLIDQYAKDNHVDISDADVQKKEDEIKSKYPPGQFEAILKAQNLSENDVRRILRQQLVVEQAVGSSVHVSDADIQAYLKANHATLDTGAQVRARHILVPDLKTAELVESQLKAGAKFDELAKKYSTDPSSKDKGGELGFFSKGQMVPTFEHAAFTQPLNVVGPPVKSPFGFHVIEVEERKPAQVATLANSSDKIRKLLTQQQEQQQIPTFLASLRQKANIQIYDTNLKDALPPPPVPAPSAAAPAASSAAAPAAASPAPAPAASK